MFSEVKYFRGIRMFLFIGKKRKFLVYQTNKEEDSGTWKQSKDYVD